MPAKYRYKTEEAYRRALELECQREREQKYNAAISVITDIDFKCNCTIPELDEEEQELSLEYQQQLRNKKTEKIARELRRNLLRRYKADFGKEAIIVIETNCNAGRGKSYFHISLTAYGASLRKDWLKNEVRDLGFDF